jgi:hypothetical protein
MTLIPFDDDLPGFQTAFDLEQVRTDIEEALPRLGDIQSCRIDRFRYRQGARATFMYETLGNTGKNWITATLWPGSKAWNTFKQYESAGYAARTHALLEKFPHDSKLPAVARVLLGDHAELLAALRSLHGKSVCILSIKPVRYRPHIACVMQVVTGQGDIIGEKLYYLKLYADENDVGVTDLLSGLHRVEHCSILCPSRSIPTMNAVLWPQVPGIALSNAVQQGDGGPAIAAAAASLRAWHGSQQTLPALLAADTVRRDTEKHTAFVEHFLPETRQHLTALGKAIPVRFDNSVQMPIHHDMKPEHVLVLGEDCTLIDVEGLALGDPAIDIGNMAARLEAMSWLEDVDASTCRGLASQFVRQSLPLESARITAATALGKIKLATYAISHQIDAWKKIAVQEIENATRMVAARSDIAERNAA